MTAALPMRAPISASERPAATSASGSEAMKAWNPTCARASAAASRSTPESRGLGGYGLRSVRIDPELLVRGADCGGFHLPASRQLGQGGEGNLLGVHAEEAAQRGS